MTFSNLSLKLHPSLYLRDPNETELGRLMVRESIRMIDDYGIEGFTIKKLAEHIKSTEASIYRYFENKHHLLTYLICRYWAWLRFRIDYENKNVSEPKEKLSNIIRLVATLADDIPGTGIDEAALHRIVVAEASKVYLTRIVDELNNEGMFTEYKNLCHRIAHVIMECNPTYPFPNALATTILETSRDQLYFVRHLPSLTNYPSGENQYAYVIRYLEQMVRALL